MDCDCALISFEQISWVESLGQVLNKGMIANSTCGLTMASFAAGLLCFKSVVISLAASINKLLAHIFIGVIVPRLDACKAWPCSWLEFADIWNKEISNPFCSKIHIIILSKKGSKQEINIKHITWDLSVSCPLSLPTTFIAANCYFFCYISRVFHRFLKTSQLIKRLGYKLQHCTQYCMQLIVGGVDTECNITCTAGPISVCCVVPQTWCCGERPHCTKSTTRSLRLLQHGLGWLAWCRIILNLSP